VVALCHGAVVGETGQAERATRVPEKLDQWHDLRKSVALVSMVLFFFCVVALGFVVYQLAIVGDDDGTFDLWSFLDFMSVAVPLGVRPDHGSCAAGRRSPARRNGHHRGPSVVSFSVEPDALKHAAARLNDASLNAQTVKAYMLKHTDMPWAAKGYLTRQRTCRVAP
jgi:hypothetical protein